MPRRAMTLIELLIAIAIIAILSGGLVFSSTQILTRSVLIQGTMQMEQSLANAVDALSGDVAQCTASTISGEALALKMPPDEKGRRRIVVYSLEGSALWRRSVGGDFDYGAALAEQVLDGEIEPEAQGVSLRVTAGFSMGWRTVERRIEVFVAWPEGVGR
jgi:prepilin-type N-terminal cleavage/methylation domain-containing protein